MSSATSFQRARLAAAQPLTAAAATIPVTVTPELIAALSAAMAATEGTLTGAPRLELHALHLQASIVQLRRSMS